MKKYHQLLLFVVSVISLALFLIYRHQYNQLHYVLEVFNFFGQPCNVSNLEGSENILSQHDWGPAPSWQEYDGGYIYSAFLTAPNEAKALSVLADEKFIARNCYFWFEERKKPLIGTLKYSKIANDDARLFLYFYMCKIVVTDQAPYAVSFTYKMKKESDLKKLMLSKAFNQKFTVNSTICISPSSYSKRRLVEFLSFHKLLGNDHFIFYNRDIPYRLVKLLENLSKRLDLKVTFYSWNFPRSDGALTRLIIENDCLMRTFEQSMYSVTLEINEYIVPSSAYSIGALVKNIDVTTSDRLSLPIQKFCIIKTDLSKPISVSNTEVSDEYDYNVVRYIYKSSYMKTNVSTHAVDRTYASIHKYVRCTDVQHKSHKDDSVLKFATDFVRSTLFQLFIHNYI